MSISVLVAGGAGYIGSHTAKALRAASIDPVVIDNLCTGNRFATRYGPFYECSISDGPVLREVLDRHRPVGVMLFAAHAYVGESTVDPGKYFQNNVGEAIQFLSHLRNWSNNIPVVFSSSCSVYGSAARIPITEASAVDPLSPYAEAKLFLEKALRWYDSAYGLRSICLRYFNAAGDDPDGELGEHHDPETHLIPLAMYAAMGKMPLRVFGSDYPTPDGTAIRDYVHVSDLASAHVLALRHLLAGGKSLTLNLGTGRGHSVGEIIRAVEKVSGRTVAKILEARRTGDAPALVADFTRSRELLGWQPIHSSLETIIETAWQWHAVQGEVPRAPVLSAERQRA